MKDTESDDYSYQCKQCPEKFKITADLQKHMRLNHRKPKNIEILPVTECDESTTSETEITPNNVRRDLTCKNCFAVINTEDSVDSVTSGVIWFTRDENGSLSFKCPFCVEVKVLLLQAERFDLSKNEKEKSFVSVKATRIEPNLTMRRMKARSLRGRKGRYQPRPFYKAKGNRSFVQDRTQKKVPKLRKQKKRLVESKSKAQKKKFKSSSFSSTVTSSRSSMSMPPKSKPGRPGRPRKTPVSSLSSSHQNQLSQAQSERQILSDFKSSYHKVRKYRKLQNNNSSSQGSDSSVSGSCNNNYLNPRTVKVSVLINNNPVDSTSRLVFPTKKLYKQRKLVCQNCDYVGKSIRDLQHHTNTHLDASYPCDFCSAIYRSKCTLIKHEERHHSGQIISRNPDLSANQDMNSLLTPDADGSKITIISNNNNNQVKAPGRKYVSDSSIPTETDYDENSSFSNLSSTTTATTSMITSDDSQPHNQFDYFSCCQTPTELGYHPDLSLMMIPGAAAIP